MAKILYRQSTAPTEPGAVSGGSAAKLSPLTYAEGDWNYYALNQDIQSKAPIDNPVFTNTLTVPSNVRYSVGKYNEYKTGIDATIPTGGIVIGEYLPVSNGQNTSIFIEATVSFGTAVTTTVNATVNVRSDTMPATTGSVTFEYTNSGTDNPVALELWRNSTNGRFSIFLLPSIAGQSVSWSARVFERVADNGFSNKTTLIAKDTTALTVIAPIQRKLSGNIDLQVTNVTATTFSGNGALLTNLDATNLATGTIPAARGVVSGSTTPSFLGYSGTAITAGMLNGGAVTPTNATRLNYEGYFYATRFYGDGSNLTNVSGVDTSKLPIAGGTMTGHIVAAAGAAGSQVPRASEVLLKSELPLAIANGGTGGTTAPVGFNALSVNRTVASSVAQNTAVLVAGTVYVVDAASVHSRPLPSAPSIGDTIEFQNGLGNWTGNFTLTRGNAGHYINGLLENVVFNTNSAYSVKLTYATTNRWTLTV